MKKLVFALTLALSLKAAAVTELLGAKMMSHLTLPPSYIVVFKIKGCPACEKMDLLLSEDSKKLTAAGFKVYVMFVDKKENQGLYPPQIDRVPVTLVIEHGKKPHVVFGAPTDAETLFKEITAPEETVKEEAPPAPKELGN
jgi:thiol-disulfide isomerase/thioredoxin